MNMRERAHQVSVLFVEDDRDNALVTTQYLQLLGCHVTLVSDGAEALARLRVMEPDVILLDLVMPTMDGFEFMRVYEGPVPIVVMSAWTDLSELPREPFAVVVKPSSMRQVVDILRAAKKSWRE